MKIYCDECRKYKEYYVSNPISTTFTIQIMFGVYCIDDHYLIWVDDALASLLERGL